MADKKISALTAATTPLAGTEVLPIVQSGSTVKVANNDLRPKQIQSNATSGVLQVAGPAAAATRVMTTPDANFTVARTDAAQTFTGTQDVNSGDINVKNGGNVGGAGGLIGFGANNANGVMGLIKGSLANTASGADQGSLVMQTRPIGAGLQALRDVGVIGADGNITVSIGNLIQGTAAKGVTTGGSFSLGLGTNGSTTQASVDTSGNFFAVSASGTAGNGNFNNGGQLAALASNASARSFSSIYKYSATNNATVDAWYGRDAAGSVFGNSFLVGHFYVYVSGASGANGFAGVYAIQTTGDGTTAATLTAVSSVTRGTSPVSSVQIANDGVAGAIKLTITYINNSGVVTGGGSTVTFVGQIA